MTRKVDIVSLAFIRIGQPPVNDLDSGGDYVASASKIYDTQYENALTDYDWGFARTVAQLTRLTASPPSATAWANAFQLPADCLTPRGVIPYSDYEVMSGRIYSNQNDLWLEYLYKPIEANLPSYFIDYLVIKLCADFCVLVTGKQSLQQQFLNMIPIAFNQASYKDSRAHPQHMIKDSPFTQVRN